MSNVRSRRTLVAAARLYYVDGLSQQEAAARLGMTRSNFSRVLSAARQAGVIEFRIHDEVEREVEMEQELCKVFGLRRACVSHVEPGAAALIRTARLAARLISESLDGVRVVAVSWGTSVAAVVNAIEPRETSDVRVVQLVGGLTSFDAQASAHDLVRELGKRLNADYHYLHAPGVFDSADALRSLSGEQSVKSTLELARHADLALVGIGSPSNGSSHALLTQLRCDDEQLRRFWKTNPVGDVCGRYFDSAGRPVEVEGVSDRILAIDLPSLQRIPLTIGTAVGKTKADAVLGALRGNLVNALVCDQILAREVLARQG